MKSPQGHLGGSPEKQNKPYAQEKKRKEWRSGPFKEIAVSPENWGSNWNKVALVAT